MDAGTKQIEQTPSIAASAQQPAVFDSLLRSIWTDLADTAVPVVDLTAREQVPAVFAVSSLASASMAAAAASLSELLPSRPAVSVDQRLASLWFGWSLQPQGWSLPPAWDAIAGDYAAADGWIRLHTNVPAHRAAALAVLQTQPIREQVASAVCHWRSSELESAVVAAGGCAARMQSIEQWSAHPQGRAVSAEPLVIWRDGEESASPAWTAQQAQRPLAGLRVLDLTRVLAGPVATRWLSGFGADVLRIDPPDWEEPGVIPDVTLGKRCARLDLRRAAERAQFEALLQQAQVLVHGYRPHALERLGYDWSTRQRLRPGLIDVSLNAYGWSGPWAERRGFDSLVQMSAGIAATGMQLLGKDRPTPLPVQALDHATGYLMAAAVLQALARAKRSRRAVRAHLSLARTAALLTTFGPVAPLGDLRGASDADWSGELEITTWGMARRLRAPVVIQGSPLDWTRAATALGSAEPHW